MTEPQPPGRRNWREVTATWCRCYWFGIIGVPIAAIIAIVAVAASGHQGASASSHSGSETLSASEYSQHVGIPRGASARTVADAARNSGAFASWGPSRKTVDVVLYGSSSCALRPLSVRLVTNTKIGVLFGPRATNSTGACTADSGPVTTRIPAPAGLRPRARVQLTGTERDVDGTRQFTVTID